MISRRVDDPTERPPGRRKFLPPKRPSVTSVGTDWDWDDDGEEGTAGVREPRRPLPPGPLSAAAELPVPEPPVYLVLR